MSVQVAPMDPETNKKPSDVEEQTESNLGWVKGVLLPIIAVVGMVLLTIFTLFVLLFTTVGILNGEIYKFGGDDGSATLVVGSIVLVCCLIFWRWFWSKP
jgi:hypothetical protein